MQIDRRVKVFLMIIPLVLAAFVGVTLVSSHAPPTQDANKVKATNSTVVSAQNISKTKASSPRKVPFYYNFFNYSPEAAISYAMMVHSKYFDSPSYPAGINFSILQKNLDHFGSEDCAHFISEVLIAAGLTELAVNAPNGPGDNLTTYDNGLFVGSYGIVGVYRLVSYLLGYVPSVFSTNASVEAKLGYQPVPASFQGSPLATPYYVLNESMLPSYFLSPGDIIADGGVGAGHIMLYIGNGTVVQTDPAEEWDYAPGFDLNISFYGLDTLNGHNVSAIYVHIPTFQGPKTVNITVLSNGTVVRGGAVINVSKSVYLIGSFPDGVGLGNYSYEWIDNGKVVSFQQNFTFTPQHGTNKLELKSSGSNGTAYQNFTFYYGSKTVNKTSSPTSEIPPTEIMIIIFSIVAAVAVGIAVVFIRTRRINKNR